MKFFMSGEIDVAVSEAEHAARRKVNKAFSDILSGVELDCGLERWSFISIIMPDEFLSDYPEVRRYHKARRVMEFRVVITFDEFKCLDESGQVSLLIDAIDRTAHQMREVKNLKASEADLAVILKAVESARKKLLII